MGGKIMDIVYVLVNVAILLAIIGLLIMMQKKHISFTKRVFTGLGLGIVLGAILQAVYGTGSEVLAETTEWYDIVGSGYIRLLMMIVVPLVMVSIIQAIINLEKTSELGKMSAWIIDRKSTRLNSSHVAISYAVFCLKKKKRSKK